LEDPDNSQLHDGKTLLHWNHLRNGRVSGWREEASPEQCQFLATHYGSWLIARGYEPDDGWVSRFAGMQEDKLSEAGVEAAVHA
jgi:hypothetical protein